MKLLTLFLLFFSIVFIKVNAYATFQIEVDNVILDFGFMNINDVKQLEEKGTYQNEITCKSDNGNTWYLKIQALGPLQSGADYISYENFQWKVSNVVDGNGIIYNENQFNSFSDASITAYTSGPSDNAGKEINIRFGYQLSIPKSQVPGNYRSVIRYIMTETL